MTDNSNAADVQVQQETAVVSAEVRAELFSILSWYKNQPDCIKGLDSIGESISIEIYNRISEWGDYCGETHAYSHTSVSGV